MPEHHHPTERDAERERDESTDAGYRDTEEERAYEKAADGQTPPQRLGQEAEEGNGEG